MSTQVTLSDCVNAASDMLASIERGELKAADVQTQATAVIREQAGTVNGPGDALWELHCDIARQVLNAGGLSADELAEWAAAQRHREDSQVT